jgi:hypothetical protein
MQEQRLRTALFTLLLATAFLAGGIGETLRSVVLGEGDYLSWEWSREMGLDYFRRFQAVRDQWAAAEYVKNQIPTDAMVFSTIQPYALRYLTHRPIIDLSKYIESKQRINEHPQTTKTW